MKINELYLSDFNLLREVKAEIILNDKDKKKIINFLNSKKGTKKDSKKDFTIKHINKNKFGLTTGSELEIEIKILDNLKLNEILKFMKQKMSNIGYGLVFDENRAENKIYIFFELKFFYYGTINENLDIVISEKVIKRMEEYELSVLISEIKNNFILSNGEKDYFLYSIYGNTNEELEEIESEILNEKTEGIDNKEIKSATIEIKNETKAIKLIGKDYFFDLQLEKLEDKEYLIVKRIGKRKKREEKYFLSSVNLNFVNYNEYKENIISNKISDLLKEKEGYLKLWEQYSEIEGDLLLKKVRKIGLINIHMIGTGENSNQQVNILSDNLEELSVGDRLLICDDEPEYIKNEKLTWDEYKEILRKKNTLNKEKDILYKEKGETCEIIKIEGEILTLDIKNPIPDNKIITYSIQGDLSQITRREKARNLIKTGRSANPNIGLIIEGITGNLETEKIKTAKIEPLSYFVKNKIFKNEPTPIQKRAIEIALNTPDIAIIQGPPGTGKTTVITAIIERLNEIHNKEEESKGSVLITSFQHDAVRNVIERLTVNSLPTIKFGKKEVDDETMDEIIDKWSKVLVEKLKQKNPTIKKEDKTIKLDEYFIAYERNPVLNNELEILNYIKDVNLDKNIDVEVDNLINKLQFKEEKSSSRLLPLIRELRIMETAFLDDGKEKLKNLLFEYKEILEKVNNEKIYKLNSEKLRKLEEYIELSEEKIKEKLQEIKEFKFNWLNELIPKPYYREPKINEEIVEIYNKVRNSIQKPENNKDEILFELLQELENNGNYIKELIKEYSFVYASTTQQSFGEEIKKAKGLKKGEIPIYNIVIVDEAARVNPSDLMIPLSQAKEKLILVGDHKQLPHIYDEEVFEVLEENNDIENSKYYVEKSMFEHLWTNAKDVEKKDGIPRTITLDAQYRTHPLLGQFVSDNFYKKDNEDFISPRGESDFSQPLYDVPLVWIEFNQANNTKERKIGTTRARDCEADYIVKELVKMISGDGKGLSYGVITFYRGQVENIKRKIEKLKKEKDLSKEIQDKLDEVRIGSVDAFQGMEFDVIFLSVVRSYDKIPNCKDRIEALQQLDKNTEEYRLEKDRVGRGIYGFITSEQRLCVSLSRQKKLLIIVGNSDIFVSEEWKEISNLFIPAMKELYYLANEKGVIKNGRESI